MADLFSSCDCCPSIKNILVLDSEGKRVAVKYYTDEWPTNRAKLAFEKSLFTKTLKSNAQVGVEITMFNDNIVIYKFVQDLHFFVIGDDEENELILACVLQGFFDAVIPLLSVIAGKVGIQNMDAGTPLSEQTISQALATAREQLARTVI